MADQRSPYPIDDALVGRLDLVRGDVLVELGCGRGFTLAAAAECAADLVLLGLDLDEEGLDVARPMLDEAPAVGHVARADLSTTLPLASGTVTKLLCHNVLEQVPDPAAVLEEAGRVMAAGARSVWSHTDFESVIISGGDRSLTRRVVAAYAGSSDGSGRNHDSQMGRRLAGLVGSSCLKRVSVDTNVLLSTEMRGPADLRVRSTFAVLRDASLAGEVDLTVDELERWMASLREGAERGDFLYAHTTFIVVAEKA